MNNSKKFRVGSVVEIPKEGCVMDVILINKVWRTTPVIKVTELQSDGNPRIFQAETRNTIYVLAYF